MPKNTKKYVCKICDYITSDSSNYKKHIRTQKHKILTNTYKDYAQNDGYYTCEICNYTTKKKSSYDNHLNSQKHKANLKTVQNKHKRLLEKNIIYHICECGKKYKHRQSLNTHKKTCKGLNNVVIEIKDEPTNNNDVIEMMKKLMTENEKLTDLVKKMPPGLNLTNNNNNQYYHSKIHKYKEY